MRWRKQPEPTPEQVAMVQRILAEEANVPPRPPLMVDERLIWYPGESKRHRERRLRKAGFDAD